MAFDEVTLVLICLVYKPYLGFSCSLFFPHQSGFLDKEPKILDGMDVIIYVMKVFT